ncbi:MAG TPA: hypothetical protein VHX36_10330 [Candidatus Acidoferrales bacterium]|nr:hypothetical protein [Candidatus Acidoferrales bacterium]
MTELAAVALACAAVFAGCASPGEPTDRKPPTPQAVTDLAAEQSGNDVVLTFTMPQEGVDGRLLDAVPSVEIFRNFESAAASSAPQQAPPAKPTLTLTIPSGMVDRYSKAGHVRVVDTLQASDFAGQSSATAVYIVRTRVSPKRDSQNSNAVSLRLYPAADPIDDLKAEVTPSAVVLSWTPPEKTIVGPVTSVGPYRIYRAEIAPPAAGAEASKAQPTLVKLGETDAPPFSDTQAVFGATYEYSVRSMVQYSDAAIESSDSNLVTLTPKDTFPPGAPRGLVVVLVPAQGATPAHLELSWAISPETDIAGYNVYRSEDAGVQGTRQNTELLIAPAFRDMNDQPGRRYFYSVTAVDRSGNESSASGIVSGGVPAEGQPTP